MADIKLEQAVADAKAQIDKEIDEFKAALDAGTSNPESFITFAEIERKWAELKNKTNKTYSDMISTYLSSLDESEIIRGFVHGCGCPTSVFI